MLKGDVLKFSFANSKIFPGTDRDYWIYAWQIQPEGALAAKRRFF